MTFSTPTVNYLVESGPLFERMREWAQLRVELGQNLQKLAKEFGADPDRIRWSDWENRVLGFWFDRGNEPKHWKRRDTHGCSLPYRTNTQAWEKIRSISPPPQQVDFLADTIGRPFSIAGYPPLWFRYFSPQGPFMMTMPGLAAALAEMDRADDTLTDPEKSWLSPERVGARRILLEEWEVLKAQHKLDMAQRETDPEGGAA